MKYYVFTFINNHKEYVRRFQRYSHKISVTMYSAKSKAFDFGSEIKANDCIKLMGIGYQIESNE